MARQTRRRWPFLKEYDKAILKNHGWAKTVPVKIGKLVAFASIGALVDVAVGTAGLGTITAAGLSAGSDIVIGAADEFIAPKLIKGWKPNQFVDGKADEFLK